MSTTARTRIILTLIVVAYVVTLVTLLPDALGATADVVLSR